MEGKILIVNRKEIAKRINLRTGYQIGQIEEVLKALEDVSVEASGKR
jgi:phage-related protein